MTAAAQPISYDPDIAPAAALIADPTRASILRSLLPDRPLAAGELARMTGVSAATASFHLGKLQAERTEVIRPPFASKSPGPERWCWVRSA